LGCNLLPFHEHLEDLILHWRQLVFAHHQFIVFSCLFEWRLRRAPVILAVVDDIQSDLVIDWLLLDSLGAHSDDVIRLCFLAVQGQLAQWDLCVS